MLFRSTGYWSQITGVDIAALHRELQHRVQLLDGSLAFLDAVRTSGRRMWLATNAHPDSWKPKLEQTGIAHYFEHIISSWDVQAPKEDPRYWARLRERHPFDPAAAFFADDSRPVLDAARAFGIGQIVAMCHPDTSRPPKSFARYVCAHRLSELLPIA